MGAAISTWFTTSGVGVTIAAMIKEKRKAYLRFLVKNEVVTNPNLASKTIKTGISKIRPKAISKRRLKEKYSFTVGSGLRYEVL